MFMKIYIIGIICGIYLSQNYHTPDINYWVNMIIGYVKNLEQNLDKKQFSQGHNDPSRYELRVYF